MVTITDIKISDLGFYINLDSRTDRRDRLEEILSDFDIKGVERWSAKSGNNTPQQNLIDTTFEIYESFLRTDAETLLILEDDCLFLPEIKVNTKQIFNDIHSTDWDLFWLGGVNRKKPRFYKNNCWIVSSFSYAQSYIIKRRMASDVLEFFKNDWRGLCPDELLTLFAYGEELAKDPNRFSFYQTDQPLDHFEIKYKCLCYKTGFTTQYNSYSDLWGSVTSLEDWIPLHCPDKMEI